MAWLPACFSGVSWRMRSGRARTALRYEKNFRARFTAHFRNNVALRGILRFRPLAERMVRSYRRDAGYYRDALEFMLGCGNAVSVPRLFWRGLVLS